MINNIIMSIKQLNILFLATFSMYNRMCDTCKVILLFHVLPGPS